MLNFKVMIEIKNYTNLEIKTLENSEIEIKAEIPEKIISKYRDRAIKSLGKNVKIDGFREGHIPENILISKIGEQAILEEQAQMALADVYPVIIQNEKLNVIGRPEVTVTKIAPKNPIEFKIRTAVMPDIKLPDYKKIASKIELDEKNSGVSDKEVEEAIEQIKKGIAAQKKEGEKDKKVELTDEFVKTLGDFKDVKDFEVKIKENLIKEKQMKAREKRRAEIVEKIIEKSEIDIPKILVESELDKMLAQFKDDIARMQISFDEYLTKIKKTEESLRVEWKLDAEKRAKFQLILNKIATEEKIKIPKEEIEKETSHILEHYKDAKPENVRVYIESVLTNEKVFQLLEGQK
ncbi:MAG TPA: trigger factor [Candidatus Paceibacterota bacterium]|jgi:FKBP-type peptidyl-prolyl cis-trans isomerase (trigger factor)|nr:trigger factor [Candidatus Paceibacterota bacterium]MDP7648095.1 trigger factor [Candidatus Paceibacterota bacterium]HJO89624.1 trigger factor [Candidatus Paceibacterota bacterium]|tara:strand:+ start:12557 stop:13606 length:1050 start_codon:yes stop_codon:yes gene_type:complete